MLKLGICDDNARDRAMIYHICEIVLSRMGIDGEIITYQDGRALLENMVELDLLVLDIEMPEVDGLEVKQRWQGMGENTVIIFVTNHVELMPSAFGIHVYGLVAKKNMEDQLPRMMQSALEMMNQYIMLEDGVDSRDVKYIKSARIYSDLYLADGSRRITRISLGQYEERLFRVGFIRTHRTYVVNFRWVDAITDRGVRVGSEIIPVATRLRKEVKERFVRYCQKNGRYC